MTYIITPEDGTLQLFTFDFAVEEHAARHLTGDDYFSIWQTRPTVIVGRPSMPMSSRPRLPGTGCRH